MPRTVNGKPAYTEEEWKRKFANYEGDGTIPTAFILVEWDDPNETPTEAITRLNREAVAAHKTPA